MAETSKQKTAHIRALNDALRRCGRGGRIMITAGLEARGSETIAHVLAAVAAFDNFSDDNDPLGEHDCSIVRVDGIQNLR